jgi:hypothetical protein
MKESMFKNTRVVEYDSLNEFYKYICDTPFNKAFRWEKHDSVEASKRWTKTENFEEAVRLFKEGWSDMATKLVQKLKVIEKETQPAMKSKQTLSVAGYQAIVPLYLNGVPANMVNKKMIPIKQKVITLTKSLDYSSMVTAEEIIDESIKAMQIVKKLESQGYRCNLNISLGTSKEDKSFMIKVRIKSANEKMNISKLAFPLVHPSMLRRLFLRWIEVYPEITKAFIHGYGTPAKVQELRRCFPDDYVLPNFIMKNIEEIRTIEDLEKI